MQHTLKDCFACTGCQPMCMRKWMKMFCCRCEVQDLKGGDKALNAQILRDVFGGERGAVADALCLNAGVALAACQVAPTAKEGIRMAQVHTHITEQPPVPPPFLPIAPPATPPPPSGASLPCHAFLTYPCIRIAYQL